MKPCLNVSVLTANYNKSLYLKDFFDSLLASNTIPLEIIFIDDGSTDDSLSVAKQFANKIPIHLISLGENIGLANALNIGIEKCKGKYIMRLDTDDFISNNRIDLQYDYLESNPQIDVLGSNVFYYKDRVTHQSLFHTLHNGIRRCFENGSIGICHGSVMIRSLFYKKFKYNQSTFPFEEYDLFCRMIEGGGVFRNLQEPLTYYRMYNQNSSYKHILNREKGINQLRGKYFNQRSNRITIMFKALHRFFYRKSTMGSTAFMRVFFLVIAALCLPKSVVKRFIIE